MSDLVLHTQDGGTAHLTMNSPSNFNGLSIEMLDALHGAFTAIAQGDATRVVILSGQGKAFCAGHDLRQMQAARDNDDAGREEFQRLFSRCADLMQMIRALPQPVIAQVHGIATAAGCQLVAACDLAVAASGTRFGVNGVNIGLFCSTPMVELSRVVSPKAAFEMLLTGEFIDAVRAREIGLINRVTTPDDLAATTQQMAQVIASKLPAAVRLGKKAFHAQLGQSVTDAYRSAGATMCDNIMLDDTAEGIAAFLEKRTPNWS